MLPINWTSVTIANGKYTFLPIFADIAASADSAAISTPIDRYTDQVTGFDIPYHLVTCEIETIATVMIGIKNAAIINVL